VNHTEVNIINFYYCFQGFQPTLDVSPFSAWTHPSPDTSHSSYHQDPALGHITQLDDHNTAAQEYQFVSTGTDHKPIDYPPVPSVFDTPNERAEDRVNNHYSNGKKKHNQHSRRKNL
jgi:hypothetical protein